MKRRQYGKIALIACVATLFMATQARADLAAANVTLSNIAADATQANENLATVANSEPIDTDKLAAAQAQVVAIITAMENALAAYEALEEAGDDEDAAKAAIKQLADARQEALVAVGGAPDESTPPDSEDEDDDTSPNINDVPWDSDSFRDLLDELNDTLQEASSHGGIGFAESDSDVDSDVTPD